MSAVDLAQRASLRKRGPSVATATVKRRSDELTNVASPTSPDRRAPHVRSIQAYFAEEDTPRQVEVYVDTLGLFFRQVPEGLTSKLQNVLVEEIIPTPCGDERGTFGNLLELTRSSVAAIQTLAKLRKGTFTLSKVHVAYDTLTATKQEAEDLAAYCRQHVTLRYGRDPVRVEGGTVTYWGDNGGPRNLIAYADRSARTIPENQPGSHVELRVFRAKNVRAAGFGCVEDLLDFDPLPLLGRFTSVLPDYDREKFEELRRAGAFDGLPSTHFLQVMGISTAQGYKNVFPRKAAKLRSIPLLRPVPHSL